MSIPLRHFVVALGLLVLGIGMGFALTLDALGERAALAHVHLLLVGWVCVTIMGAMTQFVPVWSGVDLYSRRLASWQLQLVATGLVGFVGSLLMGRLRWSPVFGLLLLTGFWTFVYNIGRTLWDVDELDVTERHFAEALGFFLVLTVLGVLLSVGFTTPVFRSAGLERSNVVAAHATLAVFGAVLTTVFGALYQLGTMFTQADLHGTDVHLQRLAKRVYPVGVVLLATGRLLGAPGPARLGALLVIIGITCVAAVLGRKLVEMQVPWTPMHRRYAVAVCAMTGWAVTTVPVWLAEPVSTATVLGGSTHLVTLGVVGFAVLGTLYHVVPFIVWVHRYSDQLGRQQVPMVDDLYDTRLARVDFWAVLLGTGTLVVGDVFAFEPGVHLVAGTLLTVGAFAFVANLLLVVHWHSPHTTVELLCGIGHGDDSMTSGAAK